MAKELGEKADKELKKLGKNANEGLKKIGKDIDKGVKKLAKQTQLLLVTSYWTSLYAIQGVQVKA